MINFKNVNFNYSDGPAFKDINLRIPEGKISFVLGENGSGKTTLLKLMLGLIAPTSGTIEVSGQNIATLSSRQRSKLMAYIPQDHAPAFNIAVEDVILMGCANRLKAFASPDQVMRDKAHSIAQQLGIEHLLYKGYKKISGGERQLCLIGRALMQTSQLIIMDEPTSSLDFAHKLNFFKLCKQLNNSGTSIVISSHQPENAFNYADYIVFMKDHHCSAHGSVADMMTAAKLAQLYGIDIAATNLILQRG